MKITLSRAYAIKRIENAKANYIKNINLTNKNIEKDYVAQNKSALKDFQELCEASILKMESYIKLLKNAKDKPETFDGRERYESLYFPRLQKVSKRSEEKIDTSAYDKVLEILNMAQDETIAIDTQRDSKGFTKIFQEIF